MLPAAPVTAFVERASQMDALHKASVQLLSEASITDSTSEGSSTSTSGNLGIGEKECILFGIRLRILRSCLKCKGASWSNGDIPGTTRKCLFSKRKMFSREDSRNEETRNLVSKLVAKELREMKKEEVKGKELKDQVMAILEEVKTNNN